MESNTRYAIAASAALLVAATNSAIAGASFHIDLSKGNGSAQTPAPASYGDKDGGSYYDDDSYISNSYAYRYNFSDNGVGLSVEAGVVGPVDNDGTGSSSETYQGGSEGVYVGQFSGGLGVGWEINPNDLDDNYHTVDDSYGRDFLVLSFDQQIKLTKIDFDYFGPKSNRRQTSYADFQVYGGGIDGDLLFTGNIPYSTWGVVEFGTPLGYYDTFVIAPKTNDGHKKDFFKLRAVGGHVVPSPTAALGGFALLSLIGVRRRRRA